MESIVLEAPAKINLYLSVLGKFANGYHDLDMLMQSISLADRIEIRKSIADSCLSVSYQNGQEGVAVIPEDERNLAFKAWRLLQKTYQIAGEVEIHIQKNIPVGAGLAGGSSDAAAVLKGVNQLFQLGLGEEELIKLGAKLGGDVPFCIVNGFARAQGIGDILTKLPALPRRNFVLVNPGIPVLTSEIFQIYDTIELPQDRPALAMPGLLAEPSWDKIAGFMFNALEPAAVSRYPVIQEIKDDLQGLGLAPFMSGSGPSVIAFWQTEAEKSEMIKQIEGKWPIVVWGHTI